MDINEFFDFSQEIVLLIFHHLKLDKKSIIMIYSPIPKSFIDDLKLIDAAEKSPEDILEL